MPESIGGSQKKGHGPKWKTKSITPPSPRHLACNKSRSAFSCRPV